jgi:hypothetical protein
MSRIRLISTLVTLPATLLHELTHVLASLPWANEIRVRLRPRTGEARAAIQYPPATPDWLIRLHELSPAILGLIGGMILAGWWVTTGDPMPDSLIGKVGMLYVSYSWALYAVLGAADDLAGGNTEINDDVE